MASADDGGEGEVQAPPETLARDLAFGKMMARAAVAPGSESCDLRTG